MTPRTTIKLILALAGIVLFGAGIRLEMNQLRWIGLGLVAVAWVLRFWKGKETSSNSEK
ncbi:MAG: hypothetical protein FJ363_00890 [Gemmatimonadetes bacterium]|nr:hypothetical protein [Gemmatimonadota bacterium]